LTSPLKRLYRQKEHTHSKCGVDTKLGEAIATLEGRATVQRTLNKLERWADRKLLEFNVTKCLWET